MIGNKISKFLLKPSCFQFVEQTILGLMTIINALSSFTTQIVKFITILWLFIFSAFYDNKYLFAMFITLLNLFILMTRDTVSVMFQ